MPNPTEIRKQITDRIITALENDLVPWRRPWSWSHSPNAGRPANFVSKRPYSGINPLLLQLHALQHGFSSKWWGTFQQIKELGGMVRRRPDHVPSGHWGCSIVFMRPLTKAVKDESTGEERNERFALMRTYTIFNVDQADGVKLDRFRVEADGGPLVHYPDFAPAEELVAAIGADIRQGGNRACYHRPQPEGSWPAHLAGDFIQVPASRQFPDQAMFWETVLHEMAHFCEVRLGWDHRQEGYAMGEIVAEMSSCFLATELGIPQGEDLQNHAAYLKVWLAAMKADSSFVFKAAAQASKVTDFLLGFSKTKPQPVLAAD